MPRYAHAHARGADTAKGEEIARLLVSVSTGRGRRPSL